MATHLVWFRMDLRLNDNLALAAACRDPKAQVLALYIATPEQWRQHHMAPRRGLYRQPFTQPPRGVGGTRYPAAG